MGADVGGTFTDLLLVNEQTGEIEAAKVPSTPADPSIGVLQGIERVCEAAGVSPSEITHVMHGTTVATNTMLTATGARVGLVTTKGYRQVLQIARSFVPGGLGGWVIYNQSDPIAPLARSAIRLLEGSDTSSRPLVVISKTPTSLVEPYLFLTLRRRRQELTGSPSM